MAMTDECLACQAGMSIPEYRVYITRKSDGEWENRRPILPTPTPTPTQPQLTKPSQPTPRQTPTPPQLRKPTPQPTPPQLRKPTPQPIPSQPRPDCCMAMTDECNACKAGMSVSEYIAQKGRNGGKEKKQPIITLPTPPQLTPTPPQLTPTPPQQINPECCMAMTDECMACHAGMSVSEYIAQKGGGGKGNRIKRY